MLEGFLYDESHAHQFRASLLHQVHDAFGSVSVGKEVVDEKHLVAGREKILADAYVVRALLGERIHGSNQHILHRARFLLLGKHYGQLQQIAHHDGGSDAAGFDGDNLVDTGRGETSDKLHTDGFHQYRVHLVIDKVIHFQYASRIAFSVFENTVF